MKSSLFHFTASTSVVTLDVPAGGWGAGVGLEGGGGGVELVGAGVVLPGGVGLGVVGEGVGLAGVGGAGAGGGGVDGQVPDAGAEQAGLAWLACRLVLPNSAAEPPEQPEGCELNDKSSWMPQPQGS